jgi:hypothetical protein
MRISNSFSEGEIQVIDFILSTLLRGGTPNMAIRSKDFASLCRKVQAMKVRVEEIKSGKVPARAVRGTPAQSSVGVIDAPDATSAGDVEAADDTALEDVG